MSHSNNSEDVQVLRKLVELRDGGQHRPQQETMVAAVSKAIANKENLLIQAGTGTGKSWGYLIPSILSGKRVVISTATKQLSEQIVDRDLPLIFRGFSKIGENKFGYTLMKGRSNYACLAKRREIANLDEQEQSLDIAEELFSSEDLEMNQSRTKTRKKKTSGEKKGAKDFDPLLYQELLEWVDTTKSGDRSHAPAVSDKMWNQVSTDTAGCPGAAACPFSADCFSEKARRKAAVTDVVVTNHAQVAQDLKNGNTIFGDYDVLIADEMHEWVTYLSSAWGAELYPNAMKQLISKTSRRAATMSSAATKTKIDGDTKKATTLIEDLSGLLDDEEEGLKPELPTEITSNLVELGRTLSLIANNLMFAAQNDTKADAATSVEYKSLASSLIELMENVITIASPGDENVRWLDKVSTGGTKKISILRVAPLWVGGKFMEYLDDKVFIGTSATITVDNKFDSAIRDLSLPEGNNSYTAVDVGTPFNYRKQGMIYIPGDDFPEPVGRERIEHSKSVNKELLTLVKAAGGRTLALFSTREGAEKAAEYLSARLTTPVLCQGEAPPQQLVDEFAKEIDSTLCATRGFWHGVDVPGQSCSLVVMDKIPFAPMNDPLMSARKEDATKNGRNGFTEIFVADASIRLAQGAGRLIRAENDKGVVAILDTRIISKGYGKILQKALPDMGVYRDQKTITGALKRLRDTKN